MNGRPICSRVSSLLLALCLLASPAAASWTIQQQKCITGGVHGGTVAVTIDATADILIAGAGHYQGSSAPTVTTTGVANTLTGTTQYCNSADDCIELYVKYAPSTGSATFSVADTAGSSFSSGCIIVAKSAAGTSSSAVGNNNAGTTITNTGSTGSNGQLCVTGLGFTSSITTLTIDLGTFSQTTGTDFAQYSGNNYGTGLSYHAVSGAENPTWTRNASGNNAISTWCFDPAGAGPTGTTPKLPLIGVGGP